MTFTYGAYIPPANSTYFKDEDDMTILQKLQDDIAKYSNLGKVLIIGDLNSRIGLLEEQISFINEHDNRDEIFESIDIPTRNSLDQGKNSSGKRLIEIMSDANLLCLNGRKLGDTIGRLTCHEYNGSSTVDLALCSWDIYNKIQYFKVPDPVWYSDHCPIQLTIQTENFFEEQPIWYGSIWKPSWLLYLDT